MVKYIFTSLFIFSAAVAGAAIPNNAARLFISDSYSTYRTQDRQDLSFNGQCTRLRGEMYHNIGSISIPCREFAPEGKKFVCTLYSDTACADSMVDFDHSHFRLFDYGDTSQFNDVGGRLGSVKCETVDASKSVSNDNGSPSTKHQSSCVGDPCNSDSNCIQDAQGSLYCYAHGSNTCQRAHNLPAGTSCQDNAQCQKGYCAGSRPENFKCRDAKGFLDNCDATAECETGLKCCNNPFLKKYVCENFCTNLEQTCIAVGLPCFSNSACCSKNCQYAPNAILSGECQ